MKNKPTLLLIVAATVLFLLSLLFVDKGKSIDVHLHDTYFIFSQRHIFWFFAFLNLMLWLLSLIAKKVLFSNCLNWLHVIVTIATSYFLAFTICFFYSSKGLEPRKYIDLSNSKGFSSFDGSTKTLQIAFTILVLVQIVFLINVIIGIVRKNLTTT